MIKVANASTSNATGKDQVRICDYYDKGWNIIIRPPHNIVNGIVFTAEKLCNNDLVLYSQEMRYSLYKTLANFKCDLGMIKEKVYCDCSSFVGTCLMANGVNIDIFIFTTSTMRTQLRSAGFEIIDFSKDKIQKGDILVKEGSHTVIVVETDNDLSINNQPAINDLSMGVVRLQDKNSYLNIREKPTTNAKVIFTLRDGEHVNIMAQVEEWFKISNNGRDGFCYGKYIK